MYLFRAISLNAHNGVVSCYGYHLFYSDVLKHGVQRCRQEVISLPQHLVELSVWIDGLSATLRQEDQQFIQWTGHHVLTKLQKFQVHICKYAKLLLPFCSASLLDFSSCKCEFCVHKIVSLRRTFENFLLLILIFIARPNFRLNVLM